MTYSEFHIISKDGTRLFACQWRPKDVVEGVICLVHGLGEHSGRYTNVAEIITSHNYAMLSMDLRGHGQSPGIRGHISHYSLLMEDIDCLIEEAKNRFLGNPCFVYGHSMGGNLVINYAIRKDPKIDGVIATSPWIKLTREPSNILMKVVKILSSIYPSFTLNNGLKSSDLCHDLKKSEKYDFDPLVHSKISVRLFTEVNNGGVWAIDNAAKLRLPILIHHGKADKITSYEASEEFAKRIPQQCRIKTWENLYHELHNEEKSLEVFDNIFYWIKEILKKVDSNTTPI